jgi:integrase
MRKYLQDDMGKSGLTVHGFRSTFRDWAAERTTFPRELAEASLAHTLKDKTEAAYQRGDLLSRRRALMDAWAAFCLHGEAAGDNVVPYTAPSVA